jgi:hypothetical protein
MAWTFVNGAEVASSTNSQTVAKPTGVAVGDALVYVTRTNTNQLAASTGGWFTEVSQIVSGNTRVQTWFRVVDGSEPSTFGFTTTGTATTLFITGVAVRPPSSTPVVDTFSTANNAASQQMCAPSITPTQGDDCLIWSTFASGNITTYAPPPGFTTPAGADITSTFRLVMAYNLSVGTGATGDIVGTQTGSAVTNFTGVVALKLLNPPVVASLGVATTAAASPQIAATTGARASLGVATTTSAAPQTDATGVVVVNATASLNAASASSAAQPITATGVIVVNASANLGAASSSSASPPITASTGSLASLGVASASTSAPQTTATGVVIVNATAPLGAASATTSARQITSLSGSQGSLGVAAALTSAPVIIATGAAAANVIASPSAATTSAAAPQIASTGGSRANLNLSAALPTTGAALTIQADVGPPSSSFVAATSSSTLFGDTFHLGVPPETLDGDLVVITALGQGTDDCVWFPDPEWFTVGEYFNGTITSGCWAFIADGLGSTIDLTLSHSFDDVSTVVLAVYRAPTGATLVIDDHSSSFTLTATTDATSSPITKTLPADLLIHATMTWNEATITAPTGFTLPDSASIVGRRSGAIAHDLDAGAPGTTGYITAHLSPATAVYTYLFAVKVVYPPVVASLNPASSSGSSLAITARGTGPVAIHRGTTNAHATSGTTLSLALPPGVVDGDYLYAVVHGASVGGSPTWAQAAGFVQIGSFTTSTRHNAVYLKVASGEPSTLVWTLSQPIAPEASGVLVALGPPSGFSIAFDKSSARTNTTDTAAPTTPVVTTASHDALVYAAITTQVPSHITPPSDFIDLAVSQVGGDTTVAAFVNLDAGAEGSTGIKTGTLDLASSTNVFFLALKLAPRNATAVLGVAQATTQARQIVSLAVGVSSLDSADAEASAPTITASSAASAVLDASQSTGYARAPGTITGANVTLSTATTLVQAESLTIITGAVAILEIASADTATTTIEIPFSIPPTVVSLGVASAVSEALRIIAIAGSAPVAHVFLAGRTVDQVLIATRREPVFSAPRRVPHPFASQRVLMVIRATRLASDANVIRAFRSQMEDLL